jgi:hypothetical protein
MGTEHNAPAQRDRPRRRDRPHIIAIYSVPNRRQSAKNELFPQQNGHFPCSVPSPNKGTDPAVGTDKLHASPALSPVGAAVGTENAEKRELTTICQQKHMFAFTVPSTTQGVGTENIGRGQTSCSVSARNGDRYSRSSAFSVPAHFPQPSSCSVPTCMLCPHKHA